MTGSGEHFYLIILLKAILFLLSWATPQLNFRRILLPYNQGVPTNFTLELIGINSLSSCYVWSSSHPHLVSISPVYGSQEDSCSERTVVSAVSYFPDRYAVNVLAQDKTTGHRLHCDVVIDSINSIEILMTTHEVCIDGAPELFQVVAKNKQGHTFTSLGGVEFDWKIIDEQTHKDKSHNNIVRFVPFAESSYWIPPSIHLWESCGKQGATVLLSGSAAGTGKLRCRVKNLAYKDVSPYEIPISVLPNLKMTPSHDIYMLPYSVVQYKLDVIKQGRIEEIPVSSDDYCLKLKETKYASFDAQSRNLTALKVGQTAITLKTHKNSSVSLFPTISAKVHIVNPSYIKLNIFPGQTWALKEFAHYVITTQLYDERHHKIFLTDNLKVRLSFPSRFFHGNYSSPNGTYHVLKAVTPGSGKIKAELLGVVKEDGSLSKSPSSIKVVVEQKFVIYQVVQVSPSFVLLPWDPDHQPTYQINFKAVGGTGFYTWTSSNNTSAEVISQSKDLSRQAVVNLKDRGSFIITATDMYNPDFSQSAKVSVQLVSNLDIILTIMETEVGNDIIIPVALYGYEDTEMTKYRMFDDCSKIPINVEIVDGSKFSYMEDTVIPPFGRGCKSLQLRCKSVGHSRVFIKYGSGEGALKTTAVVACHKPLKPVHPVRVAVGALASVKEISFEGGPRAWPLSTNNYYIKLSAENSSVINITRLYDRFRYNKDLHVFRIVCKNLGETTLTLSIGNNASPTNPNPAKCETAVKFVCGTPANVYLRPVIKGVKVDKITPSSSHAVKMQIPISSVKTFEVDLWVKDKLGRKFGNITSFDVLWELSDYTLAKPKDHRGFVTTVDGASSYNKVSRTYQLFELSGKTGHLNITATITGYINSVLTQQGIVEQPMPLRKVKGFTQVVLTEKVESSELGSSHFGHYRNEEKSEACTKDTCEK